jgi:hypothetical protein
VINNLAGGIIRQYGTDTDVIRPGNDGVVNNWGTITTDPSFVAGGDLIDFQSDTGGKVNNYAGGVMEGSRHVVTGDNSVTVVNAGIMIGRNGSAVNIDNGGSEAEKVFITNRGTMEGRSAELADSDGDAIDVDGLAQILNYGRIAGLGAEGYHDGEPNVSEGIAFGGGTIVNNAGAEIYGYGRAIQVDNSGNGNALGTTTIVNDGLIRGDGRGPEGVSPADAARFDLRGNEAINLVGDYEDFIGNNSTGRIIGGVSMGGGRDTLNNMGAIIATGGSAIDMGAGNDQLNLYTGATVVGQILLGSGDDVANSTSDGGFEIDGGDGNDSIAMGGNGDDILHGGAGNDNIDGGAGRDRIYGDAGDDVIFYDANDYVIDGGAGRDLLYLRSGATVDLSNYYSSMIAGGAAYVTGFEDVDASISSSAVTVKGSEFGSNLTGSAFADTLTGGAGWDRIHGGNGDDIIDGGAGGDWLYGDAGNDRIVYNAANTTIDGGTGRDTLVLKTGATVDLGNYATSQVVGGNAYVKGFEDVDASAASGSVTLKASQYGSGLTGGAFADTLTGGNGNDVIDGGAGDDLIEAGSGNDVIFGGTGNDIIKAGSGNDTIDGGDGNDNIEGGSGDDIILAGAGNDTVNAGSGNDVINGGIGNDILTGGSGSDVFIFTAGFGKDTITDFAASGPSQDFLQFSIDMFTDYADVMSHTAQVGTSIVVTLDDNNTVTLSNTSLASLTADDFRFV